MESAIFPSIIHEAKTLITEFRRCKLYSYSLIFHVYTYRKTENTLSSKIYHWHFHMKIHTYYNNNSSSCVCILHEIWYHLFKKRCIIRHTLFLWETKKWNEEIPNNNDYKTQICIFSYNIHWELLSFPRIHARGPHAFVFYMLTLSYHLYYNEIICRSRIIILCCFFSSFGL